MANIRHGLCVGGKHALYAIWKQMRQRCHNPNHPYYASYGGRGIQVCERWRESFSAFVEDMGPRPSEAYSLDRIDNNGDYEPNNCRWATKQEQSKNRSGRRLLTARGETKMISEWAAELGVRIGLLDGRLRRGWSEEAAVLTPLLRTWNRRRGSRTPSR
jgi:hypothetical protein